MNELPCEVVRDLLPSYADGLTDDKTRELVDKHIASCPQCAEVLSSMREPGEEEKEAAAAEIDFLKKNRKNGIKLAVITACAVAAVAIAALLLKLFVIGRDASYETLHVDIDVDGNKLSVVGKPVDDSRAISAIMIKEVEGEVFVSARTTLKSFLHNGSLEQVYRSENNIEKVSVNGSIVFENGEFVMDYSKSLKQAVIENWEKYLSLPEMERMLWSTMPGFISRYFETWEEGAGFVGVDLADPLADVEGFTERVFPNWRGDGKTITAFLTCYGDKDGNISYVSLTKNYVCGDLYVTVAAEPRCWTTGGGEDGFFVEMHSPYGPDIPEGVITTWDSGPKYRAANVMFMSNGVRWCVRLVDNVNTDPDLLDSAVERVHAIAEEYLR